MNKTRGLIYAILAGFIYGFTPILGKLSYMEGSNTLSLTFYRSLLSIPFIFGILKYKKIPLAITKQEIKKLAILSSLGPSLTAITLYGAYNYISVGMTTTIHYIYPVLVAAVSVIIFKEKISKEKILALVLSTIGVALFFEGSFSIVGVILALLSGVIYGAHLLYIDKSGLNAMYPFKISLFLSAFASIYMFIFGMISKTLVFNMSIKGWIYTLLVSIFVSVLANTLITMAVKNVGPTVTAIVGMFEPITSILLGIILLNEPFTLKNIFACILILTGVLIITLIKEEKVKIKTVLSK
ncbi:DMT family transporter [Sedimentibacter sp. MB31-C6]|uniref:DMT family transporter n=1 Tax=Sedimentibacter sp. MB31-C6 TaxID=3109366 RepID=UPI002DDD4608|nr:DMT family transporter [Sedimentibacter sp. MB36-C1]WSI05331.1 DMT family transporter [Sedimentibacter sp. MB36-C1]